jgi:uncharacterized protein YybS (DUF2232 family)
MKITDTLGCVGWAAFFLLAPTWIPFVGPFFSLLTPLPFIYYSAKLGFYQGVKLTALAVVIIGLIAKLTGQSQFIIFGLELGLLGLAISELFRWRLNLGQTIFLATVFMVLMGLGFLFFIALSRDMGPMEMILGYLQDHLRMAVEAYEEMGVPEEKALEFEAYGKSFMETISQIYPSLMIIGIGFAVWLNVVMAKPLFRMGHLEYPDFVPMDRWQAPDALVWVVIVSGFTLFLSSGSIRFLAINTLIVLSAIYVFHGLSITLFFLNKYHVPSLIRIGIYFLVIIQQLFLLGLAFAGLFDQWIDFRKIHRRTDNG